MLTAQETQQLLESAKSASEKTYSPYSGLAVGAAVLCENGLMYKGTNVENASYGLTICAERSAICNAVSQGDTAIRAIAVYSPGAASIPPCGACRQFITEFGRDIVLLFNYEGQLVQTAIKDLLPFEFKFSQ
ncbi:MAG: cytidine deaminase [Bacteroidota bacterium]